MMRALPVFLCALCAVYTDSVPQTVVITRPAKMDDASVRKYLSDSGINKAAELFRKTEIEFRAHAMAGQFREVNRFPNFRAHEKWLKSLSERLAVKSEQWRGVGTLVLGGQQSDLELLLTQVDSCFNVEAFIKINGTFTELNSGSHCASQLWFREGDYYFNWSTYEQFLSEADLSLLTVALPTSKNELIRYMIDGESDWQTAAFSWTPLSPADRLARIAQISNEMIKGGQ